jgi:hypothetical protein
MKFTLDEVGGKNRVANCKIISSTLCADDQNKVRNFAAALNIWATQQNLRILESAQTFLALMLGLARR